MTNYAKYRLKILTILILNYSIIFARIAYGLEDSPLITSDSVCRYIDNENKTNICSECNCHPQGTKYCSINDDVDCICLEKFSGKKCDECAIGLYGSADKGCIPCDCSINSMDFKCDSSNGQCLCKKGYRGRKCDECDVSHYQLMNVSSFVCSPCDCHPFMSQSNSIEMSNKLIISDTCGAQDKHSGFCSMNLLNLTRHCDLLTGQCSCSKESTGRTCDLCAPKHAISRHDSSCKLCDTCATSLMDLNDEVSQNLEYAKRTIETGRLSATIGSRVSELESALNEHFLGLEGSGGDFNRSLNLMSRISNGSLDINFVNVCDLIENLEKESAKKLSEVDNFWNHPRDYEPLQQLITNLNVLAFKSQEQIDLIDKIRNDLNLIEHNYLSETNNSNLPNSTGNLIEFDNRQVRKLIKESEIIYKKQAVKGLEIGSIYLELSSKLSELNDLKQELKYGDKYQGQQLVASRCLGINLTSSETGHLISKIEELHLELMEYISNSTVTRSKLSDIRQSIEYNLSKEKNNTKVMQNLTVLLDSSKTKLDRILSDFNANCSNILTILKGNNTNNFDLVSTVKQLTMELKFKTSKLSEWLNSELKSVVETGIVGYYNKLSAEYYNSLPDWTKYITTYRLVDESLSNLQTVDTTMNIINQNLANRNLSFSTEYSMKNNFSSILNTTKRIRANIIEHLEEKMSELRFMEANITREIDQTRSELFKISTSLEQMKSPWALDSGVDSLDRLIAETEALTRNISEQSVRFSGISEFSRKYGLLSQVFDGGGADYNKASNMISSSSLFEEEVFDFLYSSQNQTTNEPKNMKSFELANEYLKSLHDRIKYNLDTKAIGIQTNLASMEMRQSIGGLTKKIDYTRSILNQLRLGRSFSTNSNARATQASMATIYNDNNNGDCCLSGCIRLKNPADLNDCSTYTSISFFLKPDDNSDNGVILFIGTPSDNYQKLLKKRRLVASGGNQSTRQQTVTSFTRLDGLLRITGKSNIGESSENNPANSNGHFKQSSPLGYSPNSNSTEERGELGAKIYSDFKFPNDSLRRRDVFTSLSDNDTSRLLIGANKQQPTSSESLELVARKIESLNHTDDLQSRLQTNSLVSYGEYLAIELRQRKLAIVLNLGSNIIEEIEDDVVLRSGIWYKIAIVRVGSLLSISTRSNLSSSSLTRPLSTPHTTLDLDPKISEIFLAGLPLLTCHDWIEQSGQHSTGRLNDERRPLMKGSPFGLIQSRVAFSGQVDNLRLNERKLGLWNVWQNLNTESIGSFMSSTGDWLEKSALSSRKEQTNVDQSDDKQTAKDIPITNYKDAWQEYRQIFDEPFGDDTIQFFNGYLIVGPTERCINLTSQQHQASMNQTLAFQVMNLNFKTGIQSSILIMSKFSNSSHFLVVQLNAGQLDLVLIEDANIIVSKSFRDRHKQQQQQQQQQQLSQQQLKQQLILTDHSWHNIECHLRVVASQTENESISIHLNVDGIQVSYVNLTRNFLTANNLCIERNFLGGGLNHLSVSHKQLLPTDSLITNNFTGCMQPVKSLWLDSVNLAKTDIAFNVRERTCSEPVRMISFPKPKSNTSCSFVQFLNINNELNDILLEDLEQFDGRGNLIFSLNGHIKRLTIRFRTQQTNGLLVHHSRPDHSSFMSIYINGGRLMVAVNFDYKTRFESHFVLNDGQWHSLHLIINRRLQQIKRTNFTQSPSIHSNGTFSYRVRHIIQAIIDDRYMFKDRFNVLIEPLNLQELSNVKMRGTRRLESTDTTNRLFNDASNKNRHSNKSLEGQQNQMTNGNNNKNNANSQVPFGEWTNSGASNWEQLERVLYFGGVEDKYIPLLRSQQIPTNYYGCIADVTINNIRLNLSQTNKNQGVLMNQCQMID